MYICIYSGHCDTDKGICTCFTGFASSNGKGNAGSRGDCGYNENFAIYSIVPTCPLYNDQQCGGSTRGVCNNATGMFDHIDTYIHTYICMYVCMYVYIITDLCMYRFLLMFIWIYWW